jgi:uncharacterized protein (TIGR02466 family)
MQMIPMFGTYIGAAKLKSLDVDAALEHVKTLDEKYAHGGDNGNVTVTQRLLDAPMFSEVKKECEHLAKAYVDVQGHQVDDVKIVSSWGNTLGKDEPIHVHMHPNSYVSGVLYLTGGSRLNFHHPLITEDLFTFRPLITWDADNHHTWQVMSVDPEPAALFLFPSKLKHHVDANDTDYRYSIAFNTLPIGSIGDSTKEMNIATVK